MANDSHLFGRLAVEHGFCTQDQIDQCLRVQAQLGGRHHVGALLIHRGFITEPQLQVLLEAQRRQAATPSESPAPSIPAASPAPAAPARSAPTANAAPATSRSSNLPEPAARLPEGSKLATLLEAAEKNRASDVHLHPDAPVAMRGAGRLMVGGGAPLAAADLTRLLEGALSPRRREQLQVERSIDLLMTTPNGLRCRGNLYVSHLGLNATFRLIRRAPPALAELGLPEQLAQFTNFSQGMVLVAGLSGAGKSTTLAALVNLIAEERAEHILCLEDPVEILHPPKKALVNQRQVGRDTESFARALRGALREDPDVIVIGELRDPETISLAVNAAETGHLVLGSMSTATSARAISRILSAFPPAQQPQVRAMVSESLKGVVTQRFVPTVDGGRALALEVLVVTHAVASLIRDDKLFQLRSAMQTAKSVGTRTMDDSLRELVLAGRVRPEDARTIAESPQLIPNGPSAPTTPLSTSPADPRARR